LRYSRGRRKESIRCSQASGCSRAGLWAGLGSARSVEAGGAEREPPLRELWRYGGLPRPLRPVIGPGVTSDVAPAARELDDLVDAVVPRWAATTWAPGAAPVITFDLRAPVALSGLDIAGHTSSQDKWPDPFVVKAAFEADMTFSNDGFQADVRKRQVTFEKTYTIEPFHKGMLYFNQLYRARDLNEHARFVRFTPVLADPKTSVFGATEFTFRSAGPGDVTVLDQRVADLDGDGAPELVLATDQHVVVVLGADGAERWRAAFPGRITWISAADLEADGRREVIVCCFDQSVSVWEHDGGRRWRTDLLAPDFTGDLVRPYSACVWQRGEAGGRGLAVGNYHAVTFLSHDGSVEQHVLIYGADQDQTLTTGADLNGDGVEDALFRNIWRHVVPIDGKTRAPFKAPDGKSVYWRTQGLRTLAFRLWTPSPGAAPVLLHVSDAGAAAYDPFRPAATPGSSAWELWRVSSGPVTGFATADFNGDGAEELVLAREDGFLVGLDSRGGVWRKQAVGRPLTSLAALPTDDGIRLVAVSPRGLHVFDDKLAAQGVLAGDYRRVFAVPESSLLIAVTRAGDLSAWRWAGESTRPR